MGGKQGLPRGVLTAAAHGVGMGQLGEAWLAEVAALALHVLLADAAPRERVADGARHCAIRVALAGWKHERSGMAEEPGDRGGAQGGHDKGLARHSRRQASGWVRSCRWLRK